MTERKNPRSGAAENGDTDTFLLRWAKRKARAERDSSSTDETDAESIQEAGDQSGGSGGRQQSAGTDPAAPVADSQAEPVEVKEEKGDEDMPSLDTIDQGGSVADFFSSKVSPALRQAALRRLFGQGTLQVGDDLDDYAGDYTKFTKLGDIVTTEMRHRMEVVRKRLLERNAESGHAEPRADDESAAVAASSAEPESEATDDGHARRRDGEEFVEGDAEHRSDETRITKESTRHDPDPG